MTRDFCVWEKKPFVLVDAAQISVERAVTEIRRFVVESGIQVLNVAGPRASGWNEGYKFALMVVSGVIGFMLISGEPTVLEVDCGTLGARSVGRWK